jgi:outer membrane cobalamin receptor
MIRRFARLVALVVAFVTSAPALAFAQGSSFVSLDSSAGIPALDMRVTVRFDRAELRNVVVAIARLASLRLTFDPELPGLARPITLTVTNVTAREALQRALESSAINARVSATGQLVLIAASRATDAGVAIVRGVTRSPDNVPLAGVRVELVGTRFSTYSRDDGSFTLGRVPRGAYSLRAMRVGFRPASRDISVDTTTGAVDLVLESAAVPLAEVVVTPAYYGLMAATVAVPAVLDRQQLETIPQFGEDIFRAMSRLPGVAADDYSASFAVRGASGDELYVTLDGLQLIQPFHLRDMRNALSIIDIRTLDRTELIAGGAPAEFGDHTGGVLRMSTITPSTDRVHVSTGVSVMSARAMADGSFAGGKGSWLVSARRGYVDLAMKILAITDSIKPWYYDAFAKAQYNAGRYGHVWVEALAAQDRLRFAQNGSVLSSRYPSRYAWTRWQSAISSRVDQETVVSVAGLEWQRDALRFDRDVRTIFIRDRRTLHRVAGRQDWTVALSERAMLRFGGALSRERAGYDYHSIFRRTTADADSTITHFDTTAVQETPVDTRSSGYAALRARPLGSLTIEGGMRFDATTYAGDRSRSPRINASWQLNRTATLRGAWGRHVQSQPLFALQAESGEKQFGLADRAEQREIGLDLELPRSLSFRAQTYERVMSNERARWINTGPLLDALPELAIDRALLAASVGRSQGAELTLARHRADHIEWSAGYTLSRSTDDVQGVTIPRAADQRHAVVLDWAFHPTSNAWRVAVAAVWHSGRPYTPNEVVVDTVVDTPNQFSISPVNQLGAVNSLRTPSYHRIDARWTRYVDVGHGRLIVFAEVFNVLNTKNSRGSMTSVNLIGRQVSLTSQPEETIGRFPTLGLTWEF